MFEECREEAATKLRVVLRECSGTFMVCMAQCQGAVCSAKVTSRLKSQTRRKLVSAACASSDTIGHKGLLPCHLTGFKGEGKKMTSQSCQIPQGFSTFLFQLSPVT